MTRRAQIAPPPAMTKTRPCRCAKRRRSQYLRFLRGDWWLVCSFCKTLKAVDYCPWCGGRLPRKKG